MILNKAQCLANTTKEITCMYIKTCVCVCVCVCARARAQSFSQVRLFVIPWTIACQALMSMGFSRQECWSGLPFPSPGDLPAPGIEPTSPALQADSLLLSHQGSPYIKTSCNVKHNVMKLLQDAPACPCRPLNHT